MKSFAISPLFAFALSALGARAATPTKPIGQGTKTIEARSVTASVLPDLQVRWKSTDGIKLPQKNDWTGHIMKGPREEVRTAVHFSIPEEYNGLTCNLRFRLSQGDWIVNSGSNSSNPAKFDIYRLNGCLNDAYTWASPLTRGIKVGILTPKKGDIADWEHVDMREDNETEQRMESAPSFSCVPGEYSFEMIARPGVNIGWHDAKKGSGLSMEVCGFNNDDLM